MENNAEHTELNLLKKNYFQCYHNNRGYCRYGQKCHFQHFNETCQKRVCKDGECPKRHPKICKWGQKCKFKKKGICAFKHESEARNLSTDLSSYKDDVEKLKTEIEELKNNNKIKQRKLCELFSENDERETIIDDINDELEELKMSVNRFVQENTDLRSKIETLQTIKCVICYNIFLSESDLRSHLLDKHELKENFNCKTCDEISEKTKDTELLVNDSSVMYYCDKCDFQYDEEDAVKAHNEIYHENKCDDCGENLEDEGALKKHIELQHVHKCDKCDFTTTTSKGLKIHHGVKHKEVQSKSEDSVVKETYSCNKCCLKFTTKKDLKTHKDGMHKAVLIF